MQKREQTIVYPVRKVAEKSIHAVDDHVAIEAPLEIRLRKEDDPMGRAIAVTMRTPGKDWELAMGFLFTEGILKESSEVLKTNHEQENKIEIVVQKGINIDLKNADRNFYTTSSCGVCGKASIEAIRIPFQIKTNQSLYLSESLIKSLPERARTTQHLFELTGGIHASSLFDSGGNLLSTHEDVGRHNALDKLIGEHMMNNRLPLDQHILLLSGRASFELVQKAAMAGIQVIVAIGAPSSLAIDMAKEHQITLIGFLKMNRFNIYSGHERIAS